MHKCKHCQKEYSKSELELSLGSKFVTNRTFFNRGDLIITEDKRIMMFVKSQGLDMKVIADPITLKEEAYTGILIFDPGMIHKSQL